MASLGARTAPEQLVDCGLQLWHTMGRMRPEDVAQFEHRALPRDDC